LHRSQPGINILVYTASSRDLLLGDFSLADGTLSVTRDLYWELESEFDEACDRLVESSEEKLALDLTDVGFIFSPYVSRIVRLCAAAKERGKDLRILISPKLGDLFEMAGLTEELNVQIVEDDA